MASNVVCKEELVDAIEVKGATEVDGVTEAAAGGAIEAVVAMDTEMLRAIEDSRGNSTVLVTGASGSRPGVPWSLGVAGGEGQGRPWVFERSRSSEDAERKVREAHLSVVNAIEHKTSNMIVQCVRLQNIPKSVCAAQKHVSELIYSARLLQRSARVGTTEVGDAIDRYIEARDELAVMVTTQLNAFTHGDYQPTAYAAFGYANLKGRVAGVLNSVCYWPSPSELCHRLGRTVDVAEICKIWSISAAYRRFEVYTYGTAHYEKLSSSFLHWYTQVEAAQGARILFLLLVMGRGPAYAWSCSDWTRRRYHSIDACLWAVAESEFMMDVGWFSDEPVSNLYYLATRLLEMKGGSTEFKWALGKCIDAAIVSCSYEQAVSVFEGCAGLVNFTRMYSLVGIEELLMTSRHLIFILAFNDPALVIKTIQDLKEEDFHLNVNACVRSSGDAFLAINGGWETVGRVAGDIHVSLKALVDKSVVFVAQDAEDVERHLKGTYLYGPLSQFKDTYKVHDRIVQSTLKSIDEDVLSEWGATVSTLVCESIVIDMWLNRCMMAGCMVIFTHVSCAVIRCIDALMTDEMVVVMTLSERCSQPVGYYALSILYPSVMDKHVKDKIANISIQCTQASIGRDSLGVDVKCSTLRQHRGQGLATVDMDVRDVVKGLLRRRCPIYIIKYSSMTEMDERITVRWRHTIGL